MRPEHTVPRLDRSIDARRDGFTLLEMAVVVAIIGVLFTLLLPRLEGLSPKYRLRVAARELGSLLEDLRLTAISRGVTVGIHYVFDGSTSAYQIIPPPPLEYPEQPPADRERLQKKPVREGVQIVRVTLRASGRATDQGSLDVLFSPAGTTGSHSVTLTSGGTRFLTLAFNTITGTADYFEGDTDAGPEDFDG